ncbi:MAG: hypothetical protein IJ242_15135 [Clostridia bacterium]|nr:hypothetical protein [Clostridia bacterium]
MQSYLTMSNLELTVVTILAVCWAVSMVLSARSGLKKAHEENRQPFVKIQEQASALQTRIETMEGRLLEIERRSDIYGDKMTLVLRSQLSILSHLVNGNSVDKLRQSLTEINEYLVNR